MMPPETPETCGDANMPFYCTALNPASGLVNAGGGICRIQLRLCAKEFETNCLE